MNDNKQRLHAEIYGHVQGVSFRFYTQHKAIELDLMGWVRNRSDGSVEVIAEGDREQLEIFLQFLHQAAPAANVTRVDDHWLAATGELSDFRVR